MSIQTKFPIGTKVRCTDHHRHKGAVGIVIGYDEEGDSLLHVEWIVHPFTSYAGRRHYLYSYRFEIVDKVEGDPVIWKIKQLDKRFNKRKCHG